MVVSSLAGTLNDLIVVESGKLYVTQFLAFPNVLDSQDFHSLKGNIYGFLNFVYLYSGVVKICPAWFCSFDPHRSGEVDANCFVATPSLLLTPNGITVDNDGYIYIADSTENLIRVYTRDQATNRLTQEVEILIPRGLDNIIFDEETGNIYGGEIILSEILNLMGAATNNQTSTKTEISGGLLEITIKKDQNGHRSYTAEEIMYLPGSVISSLSVAYRIGDQVLFGSWYDEGVVICPYPQNK